MSSKSIVVDGVTYAPVATGNRCVVVMDRGWIFAGDVAEENGRIRLSRAVNVQRWDSVGFDGMIANPKGGKVVLKPVAGTVDLPADAEIFRVPVAEDWGL